MYCINVSSKVEFVLVKVGNTEYNIGVFEIVMIVSSSKGIRVLRILIYVCLISVTDGDI